MLLAGRVEPRRDTPPPHRGSPVLSHPATVPSQIPLRRAESHSERFLDVSQYETLETLSKGLRLAYSASGPPARCTARRGTTGHTMRSARTSPSAPVVRAMGVAILTALTRQKSHHTKPFSTAKEIGCYQAGGRGRGCDPAHAPRSSRLLDLSAGNQRYGVVNEPCSGPVGPGCWTSFL